MPQFLKKVEIGKDGNICYGDMVIDGTCDEMYFACSKCENPIAESESAIKELLQESAQKDII